MKKIAVVFASAGLLALAACGEKPANETANASNAVVENVVENAANAADNAANAADNAANAAANAADNAANAK
ncbi:hypothetical protein [Sphingobium estronivorans]|uniref:hypothetical protein n=1 Tax=Sphingobium estronivorans TaxID=1577690 RepID=UPI00123BA4C8|nr:hypothetical protein [Sphingobium estronivorans]